MAKKLSILELFDSTGFNWGNYDEESDKLRLSFRKLIKSYATLLVVVFYPFKMIYCWKRIDLADKELIIIAGDIFYYFSPDTKSFLAFAGWF